MGHTPKVLFIPNCHVALAVYFFSTPDGCCLFAYCQLGIAGFFFYNRGWVLFIITNQKKEGGGGAMTTQRKEGHSCKQPCCAPKSGEEAAPTTDIFLLYNYYSLLSMHFSLPYPTC